MIVSTTELGHFSVIADADFAQVATFVGADARVHLAEEVANAAINILRAIIGSMFITGLVDFIMIVTVLYCVSDVDSV